MSHSKRRYEIALEIACRLLLGGNAGLIETTTPPFYTYKDIHKDMLERYGRIDAYSLMNYILNEGNYKAHDRKKIYIFSGKAGHGKDSCAEIVERLLGKVVHESFANLLKHQCRFLGWDR